MDLIHFARPSAIDSFDSIFLGLRDVIATLAAGAMPEIQRLPLRILGRIQDDLESLALILPGFALSFADRLARLGAMTLLVQELVSTTSDDSFRIRHGDSPLND